MTNLDQEKVKIFYNNVSNVWGEHDPWHEYSQKIISMYIAKHSFFNNTKILNAGSAGNTYNINSNFMYHVDIADKKLIGVNNAIVASIEDLPFEDNFFDNILCVGSVLNYCDAIISISELTRVLKPHGNLIIEFESSWGFEYLMKKEYKSDASIITTEYIEKEHIQWLYSPKYIFNIINTSGLDIVENYSFHIVDGLLSKFSNDKFSVKLTEKIDKVLCHIPFFKNHGNNIILCCKKK